MVLSGVAIHAYRSQWPNFNLDSFSTAALIEGGFFMEF